MLHRGITGKSTYGFLRDWEESEEEDNDRPMRIVSERITTNNIKTTEGNLKRQEVFRKRWTHEMDTWDGHMDTWDGHMRQNWECKILTDVNLKLITLNAQKKNTVISNKQGSTAQALMRNFNVFPWIETI